MRRASPRRIDFSVSNLLMRRFSTSCPATWTGGPYSTGAFAVSESSLTCVAPRSTTMKSVMGRCHAARKTFSPSPFHKTICESSSSASSRSLGADEEGVFQDRGSVPEFPKTASSTRRRHKGGVCVSVREFVPSETGWGWILCGRWVDWAQKNSDAENEGR